MEQWYRGRIVRWLDGDTVEVDGTLTTSMHDSVTAFGVRYETNMITHATKRDIYRLTIVDTPERGQPGYREAKDYVNSVLPPGTEVEIITYGADNGGWGRTLADVLMPGKGSLTISELLLYHGLAEVWVKK